MDAVPGLTVRLAKTGAVTVRTTEGDVILSDDAEMLTLPSPTPVARPPETVAIVGSDDTHTAEPV
jgi:hypothetical protein